MKRYLIAIAVAIVFAGPVYGADKAFDALDKDRDGRITQQEFMDAAEKTFNKLDRDGNGSLDREELKVLSEADRKNWLAEMDRNTDGKIDRNEFQAEALKRFSTADADENRYLDSREWSKGETRKRIFPLLQFSF